LDWWRKPIRLAHESFTSERQISEVDPVKFAEEYLEAGYNGQHLELSYLTVDGEKGLFLFNFSEAPRVLRDFLGEYIPIAMGKGLRVLIYFNVHAYSGKFIDERPNWAMKRSDGSRLTGLYWADVTSPCVNSPWREWSFKVLRELAEKHPIDGVFLDGPAFFYDTCYCEGCKLKFRERYGAEIPTKENWKDTNWINFVQFRYDSLAEYLRDAEATLKKVRPRAVIYANSSGVWPTWINARDNRQALKYQDLLGAEGGFFYRGDPMWKTSATAKLLETQAEGKPTVIFSAMRRESPWLHCNMSEDSLRQIIASTVANGASVWFGGYKVVGRENPIVKTLKDEFDFLEQAGEYVEGTVSAANVALVWSPRTADFYGAEMPTIDFLVDKPKTEVTKNFTEAFWGYYDALVRRQLAFDVLDDAAVESSNLGKYECIVLPNVACMSDKTADALRNFVSGGGRLVSTYESSLYNSRGLRGENFLLGDVFGASYQNWLPRLDHDYIRLRNGALVKGIGEKTIPAPLFALQVKPTGSAEVMGYFYEKTVGIFTPLPRVSDNPAILSSKYGEGESIYFAGSLDQTYLSHRFPAHHQLLTNAVEEGIQPIISVSGVPQTLEVVVRKKPSTGSLIVHLVNYTGEMEHPIRKALPCRDIHIRLKTRSAPSQVKALRANQVLKFKASDGAAETVLPELKVHEVIVFEP